MARATFSIGEVARQTRVRASAIRFYEDAGLLPPAVRHGGQRRYSEAILDRLAVLEYAKQSGFTLEEIRRLFHVSPEGSPLSARWQELAAAKISELDRQMEKIHAMQEMLRSALKCRCIEVEECGRRIRRNAATRNRGAAADRQS